MSCWSPLAFHSWPEARIIAGIDASMITSDGTCRFVMPRSESTIERSGAVSNVFSIAALIAAPSSCGSSSSAERIAPSPLFGLAPSFSSASWCSVNTPAKNARTAWPKMIGSETFIIVAFRCRENSRPCSLVSAICSCRNASSARARITAPSTTSPSWTAIPPLSTVAEPSPATYSIRSSSAWSIVTERSVERKSPSDIVATCERLSFDQAPIECGWARA